MAAIARRSAFLAFRLAVNRVHRFIALPPENILLILLYYNIKIMIPLEKQCVSLGLAKRFKRTRCLMYLVENGLHI